MNGDSDRTFKVPLINLTHYRRSALNPHPAAMSGDHWLETSVSSEHLALVGGLSVRKPTLFPHSHRVDAQRERGAVCEIKPRDKPSAVGEPARCLIALLLLFIDRL